MRPTLAPGDEIVATDSRAPQIGEIVVFPHPQREDFWMVKRRVAPTTPLPDDQGWVLSDNPEATRADSRKFGPIPIDQLRPVVDRLSATTFEEGRKLLIAEDPALKQVVSTYGVPEFWRRPPGFETMVLFILEQQVSLESGAAVYRRLVAAAGQMTPAAVMELGSARIMATGVTRQKTSYITDLAMALTSGEFDFDLVGRSSLPEARARLLALRGIGPWTADVYLLSALGHIDTFPVGDRALQVGTQEILEMNSVPNPDELEVLSDSWRPLRAVAARLIWHAYLTRRGRKETY